MTKKPAYRITADAQADLIEIRHYTLKQWDSKQSLRYLSKLRQTLVVLSKSPTIGLRRMDVGQDVFSFPYVSHVVYYTLDNQQLVVFAVLHKSIVPHLHLKSRSTN